MVTIGSLSWVAKVENVGDAQAKADDLADSMEEADEKANSLNESTDETSGKLGSVAGRATTVGQRMTTMTGILSLATSALFFLGAQAVALVAKLGGLSGIMTGISVIIGKIVVLGSGFIAWLGGASAGVIAFAAAIGGAFAAAIGALLGLFVVWILHISGVMDWVGRLGEAIGTKLPNWARDGLLALISIFANPLAVIGGFINGFIEGTMKGGLVEGIRTGLDRAGEVLDVFAGAWERTFGRIEDVASNAMSATQDIVSGALDGFAQTTADVWNSYIPAEVGLDPVQLPTVTVSAGPLGSTEVGGQTIFDGVSFDLPQLDTGGKIEGDGLAMLHSGEEVLTPAEVSEKESAREGAQGAVTGGGGGGGVNIQELSVEIGDQSLDLSNLTMTEMAELARLIAEETGREVETIIGGR